MKKYIILILFYILTYQSKFSQEINIPGWPCTDTTSVATQYINSTLTLKVILVEFADIKHRNMSQDSLEAYTYDDFENMILPPKSRQ